MSPSAKKILRAAFMATDLYPTLTSQVCHKAAWLAFQEGYRLRGEMAIKPEMHFHYTVPEMLRMMGE